MSKEVIVNQIRQRILDEHRKHEGQDWALIAAHKIYISHMANESLAPILSPEADKQIREDLDNLTIKPSPPSGPVETYDLVLRQNKPTT